MDVFRNLLTVLILMLTAHVQRSRGSKDVGLDDPSLPQFVKDTLEDDPEKTFLDAFGAPGERSSILQYPKDIPTLHVARDGAQKYKEIPEQEWLVVPGTSTTKSPEEDTDTAVTCYDTGLIDGPIYNVPNLNLTASSEKDFDHSVKYSRLNSCGANPARCVWSPKTATSGEYVQVDLGHTFEIVKVATKGHVSNSTSAEWVSSYKMSFSADGITFNDDDNAGKNYEGNTDGSTVVTNSLSSKAVARFVRLIVLEFNKHPSLKWEIYTCSKVTCHDTALINGPDFRLPDSSLTNSSSLQRERQAKHSRFKLCFKEDYCSWAPNDNVTGEYVQADLGKSYEIMKVATKAPVNSWVTLYKMAFSLDGIHFTEDDNNGQNYTGSNMTRHILTQNLYKSVKARYVRLIVLEFHNYPAVQWEVYTCMPGLCYNTPLINGKYSSIPDASITASGYLKISGRNPDLTSPRRSRINKNYRCDTKKYSCAWVAPNTTDEHYIQADFGEPFFIVRVTTTGSAYTDGGTRSRYVTKYNLAFSLDGVNYDVDDNDGESFKGNTDTTSHAMSFLTVPIQARYVRLIIKGFNDYPALCWEVYGCAANPNKPPPKVVFPSLGNTQYLKPPQPERYDDLCKSRCQLNYMSCTFGCNSWKNKDQRTMCRYVCQSEGEECGKKCTFKRPDHYKQQKGRTPMTSRIGEAIPVEGQLGAMDAGMGGVMGLGGMGGIDIEAKKMHNLNVLLGLEEAPPAEAVAGGSAEEKAVDGGAETEKTAVGGGAETAVGAEPAVGAAAEPAVGAAAEPAVGGAAETAVGAAAETVQTAETSDTVEPAADPEPISVVE